MLPILFLVSLVLLIALTVPIAEGYNLPGEMEVVRFAVSLRNDVITAVVWILTFISSSVPALLLCAALSVVEWRRISRLQARERARIPGSTAPAWRLQQYAPLVAGATWPLVAFVGALGTNILLRILVGRLRPDVDYIAQLLPELQADFQRFSYPSGHAGAAIIAYTACAIVAWRASFFRWAALVGAALIIAGTGFGRVYLGVHWPSDVLAGYLLGILWLSLVLSLCHRQVFRRAEKIYGIRADT